METERSGMYVSELSGLKEQLTSRDRAVIELNNELECVRQQITQLNNNYQNALQQCQLAQLSVYVYTSNTYCYCLIVLVPGTLVGGIDKAQRDDS